MTLNQNQFKNYIPGFAVGIVRTALVYPFDSLKVIMQKGQSGTSITNVVDIIKKDPKSFYRGSGISFLTVPIDRAIQYSILEKYKDKYNTFLLGFAIGSMSSLYSPPVQYITKNAVLSNKGEYGNIFKFLKSENFDIRKMYSGFTLEYPKISIGASLIMGTYTSLRNKVKKEDQVKFAPIYGGVATMVGWTAIFPIDSVLTEVVYNRRNNINKSFNSIIKERYIAKGFKGFYFGITPVYVRSIPSSAVGMFAYEFTRKLLQLD
jgi:hypothetical protein